MAAVVGREPEVINYQVYAGTASPYNFNGLVRHYYLRRGPDVADIQINLLPKGERKAQSHDIAKRVRPAVAAIAAKYGARGGGGRGAAGTAGAADPGGGDLRPDRRRPGQAGHQGEADLRRPPRAWSMWTGTARSGPARKR